MQLIINFTASIAKSRLHITDSYPFCSCEVKFWKAVNPKGNLKNEVKLECESDRKQKQCIKSLW